MLAQVFLSPGDGLSRYHRRLAEAHPLVSCAVRGDPGGRPAPLPDHFHRTTLQWIIYSADHIAIWSAPYPQRRDDLWRWGTDAVNAGGRFSTTIETTEARAPEWAVLVERWKRKACPVALFAAETAAGGSIQ